MEEAATVKKFSLHADYKSSVRLEDPISSPGGLERRFGQHHGQRPLCPPLTRGLRRGQKTPRPPSPRRPGSGRATWAPCKGLAVIQKEKPWGWARRPNFLVSFPEELREKRQEGRGPSFCSPTTPSKERQHTLYCSKTERLAFNASSFPFPSTGLRLKNNKMR